MKKTITFGRNYNDHPNLFTVLYYKYNYNHNRNEYLLIF